VRSAGSTYRRAPAPGCDATNTAENASKDADRGNYLRMASKWVTAAVLRGFLRRITSRWRHERAHKPRVARSPGRCRAPNPTPPAWTGICASRAEPGSRSGRVPS
jgi:hypothetical protein